MIYVLVRGSGSYDDETTELVFASKSKSKCEEKHAEFLVKDEHYSVVAQTLKKEIDFLTKDFVRTTAPKYADLPPKPLVWLNDKWNNAYDLEYKEIYKKEEKAFLELRWQAILNVSKFYEDTVENIENSFMYSYRKYSYSIEEVESD